MVTLESRRFLERANMQEFMFGFLIQFGVLHQVLHCIILRNLKLNSTPFWFVSLTSIYSEVYEFLPVHHAKMTEGI